MSIWYTHFPGAYLPSVKKKKKKDKTNEKSTSPSLPKGREVKDKGLSVNPSVGSNQRVETLWLWGTTLFLAMNAFN